MSEQEIKELREKYPPQVYENQAQFDDYMCRLDNLQSIKNRPFKDELAKLQRQRQALKIQHLAIIQQMEAIGMNIHMIEETQKEMNRAFHDLKHETITLNPRDRFIKPDESADMGILRKEVLEELEKMEKEQRKDETTKD